MKHLIYLIPLSLLLSFAACQKDTTTTTSNNGDTLNGIDTSQFYINSAAIVGNELLETYKCESKTNNIENSIPLEWGNVPAGTQSLAVVMYHYPNSSDLTQVNSYLHLWNIEPTVTSIPYGMADDGPYHIGSNKDGTGISYSSPCSPSAGSHEYQITIYALDALPTSLPSSNSLSVDYAALKAAIATVNILGQSTLTFNDVNE